MSTDYVYTDEPISVVPADIGSLKNKLRLQHGHPDDVRSLMLSPGEAQEAVAQLTDYLREIGHAVPAVDEMIRAAAEAAWADGWKTAFDDGRPDMGTSLNPYRAKEQ